MDSYKDLGTWIDNKLKFGINTESIVKQGQQRIYLQRKLNCFICWYNGLSIKDKNCLQCIIKICSKIIGVKLRDLPFPLGVSGSIKGEMYDQLTPAYFISKVLIDAFRTSFLYTSKEN